MNETTMAKPLMSDAWRQRIEPLLPPAKPRRQAFGNNSSRSCCKNFKDGFPPTSFFMWTDPSRRHFLARSVFGIGTFALSHLLMREGLLAQESGRPGESLPLN